MQVSTPASAASPHAALARPAAHGCDLEERAWKLLTDHKRSSGRPCILEAQNLLSFPNVAKASIGEDPKRSSGGWFGERGNTYPFQQQHGRRSGNVRHVDNVSLAPETEKGSTRTTALLHDTYQAGDVSKHDRTLFSSVLARSGAEERTDGLGDDPVLSALLRRFGEIQAEIERRHSAFL